jgi:transmembrane sensor
MTRSNAPEPEEEINAVEAAIWAARIADGRLSEQERLTFQLWLDEHPRNAETMSEIIGGWRSVEAYASTPELVDLRLQALASATQVHRLRSVQGFIAAGWRPMALAASVVGAISVALAWSWLVPHGYETGLGERRVVVLTDGSKISLDAETLVRVRYALGRRDLWLERGRAKFDVAKDPLHPFTVDAEGREVVATGTSFSVELIRRQMRVILYEGHVAVLNDRGPQAGKELVANAPAGGPADRLLTPGRELVVPAADPGASDQLLVAAVGSIDPSGSLAWEAGQLVFKDEPLSEVVERSNRYATTQLVIGDPRVGSVRISGVFREGDVDALVQGMTVAFPIRARDDGGQIVLFDDPNRKNVGQ